MKLKKNCNVQPKIMALQKSIDTKYNFWNKEHLLYYRLMRQDVLKHEVKLHASEIQGNDIVRVFG